MSILILKIWLTCHIMGYINEFYILLTIIVSNMIFIICFKFENESRKTEILKIRGKLMWGYKCFDNNF